LLISQFNFTNYFNAFASRIITLSIISFNNNFLVTIVATFTKKLTSIKYDSLSPNCPSKGHSPKRW